MWRFDAGRGVDLKLLAEEDARPLRVLIDRHRDYLRQWLPWVDQSRTVEDVRTFIRDATRQFHENNGFSAAVRQDGEIVGTLGLHHMAWSDRATSIGYWLAPEFQGRGIVTSACRAVLTYAFRELRLHRVEIRCATGNRRSCAIPERLGFRHEGILREAQWVNDRYFDLNVYGLLTHEFKPEGGSK